MISMNSNFDDSYGHLKAHTINLCIQIILKYSSTFHTRHKQNLKDICLNFNSYESKLLENINENYFGEKDSRK